MNGQRFHPCLLSAEIFGERATDMVFLSQKIAFVNSRPLRALFDDEAIAYQAAEIGPAFCRTAPLASATLPPKGTADAACKRIQRFLQKTDPRRVLWKLLGDQAEFVIGDPTEIERLQARRTEYVGILKDGKTRRFWALTLAIPCGLITSLSRTIAQQGDSRNRNDRFWY